jgi:hypothetical protein
VTTPDPDAALRRKVNESRVAQGLPPTVEDPATLERVAAVFRTVTVEPEQRGRRGAA